MSLQEQNRMLQILHKNGVSRKHVKIIIKDLRESGIFDESEADDEFAWDCIDQKADVYFSDLSPTEKLQALHSINKDLDRKSVV